jgi:RNA 2',3'-cyclic 3'-phosphodiesterase
MQYRRRQPPEAATRENSLRPPAAAKTHHTAVAALPPAAVWPPIQALRRAHDRQFHRWMPHINLLYPFVPPADFTTALPLLIDVCRQVQPFAVHLRTLRYFVHASRHATIWLDPEPRAPLITLQQRLQAVFPAYTDQGRFAAGFTPHLSIGQTDSSAMLYRLLPVLQEAWQPLEFVLTAVALLHREADHPFHVAHWLPFGNSD